MSPTSTAPQSASACRVVRSGQPIHHARSVVVPGPNRRSQCPASSAAATRGSSPSSPPGSQSSVAAYAYAPLIQLLGRVRTIFPAKPRMVSTRVWAPWIAA